MKLSTTRYTFILSIQLLFILCDIIFNCVTLFPRSRDGLLVLFIFQDLFLVLAITTMLMTLFSTYLFQAGLVEVLVQKFRYAGAVSAGYLLSSIILHAVWLLQHWNSQEASSPVLVFLFTVQRCLAPWYYYVYKRAALRISDPRFYEDLDWIGRPVHSQ